MTLDRMALISCGPSAATSYPGSDGYDFVAGCRDAVSRWRCDWWCFVDIEVYATITPLSWPHLWIPEHVEIRIGRNHLANGIRDPADAQMIADRYQHETRTLCDTQPRQPQITAEGGQWIGWSGTTGLGLAFALRPRRLDVYGMDLGGSLDHRGNPSPDRTDARWTRERAVSAQIIAALRAVGVDVNMIGPWDGEAL